MSTLERQRLGPVIGLILAAAVILLSGCSAAVRLAIQPFYRSAELDPEAGRVLDDVVYRETGDADADKHRLDLFHPNDPGWPVMVFVHGGGLIKGDKGLDFGGLDIYANVGRYYAARGVGVAVVNYRLQDSRAGRRRDENERLYWTEQADDVAAAIAWVTRRAPELGSDGRVFVSGHSAGAWLAARVALDRRRLERFGLEPRRLAGVITVSGSGFDLRDERTWELFGQEKKWARRFDPGIAELDWHEAASVVPLLDALAVSPDEAPPFLLIHTTREWEALGRQNRLFYDALQKAGIPSELMTVTTDSHGRMIFAMSRDDKPVATRILEFLRDPSPRPTDRAPDPTR